MPVGVILGEQPRFKYITSHNILLIRIINVHNTKYCPLSVSFTSYFLHIESPRIVVISYTFST